jgi:hypothetical protein
MKVEIDGVRYVPAVQIGGIAEVLMTLALQYHTPETLAEYGIESLRILVSDDPGEGESFQDFAARLAGLDRTL